MAMIYLSGRGLVGVGVVHAGGGDVVELLAGTGLRLRDVDDVEDLGAAETGDLHGTHVTEANRARMTGASDRVAWKVAWPTAVKPLRCTCRCAERGALPESRPSARPSSRQNADE